MRPAAPRWASTCTTVAAPRLAASRPRAPDPAYRSRTAAPARSVSASMRENTASRTRSLVGRVCGPRGVAMRRPPSLPAMIRVISAPLQERGALGVDPLQLGPQRVVPLQLRVVLDHPPRRLVRLDDELLVTGEPEHPQRAATAGLGR